MRMRTTILTIILSLLFASDLPAKQEQRLALLIGNSNYNHGGSLPNPVNDVRAMEKALESLGFVVMKYEDCSQKTMKRAMDEFGRTLKEKDVGLFFYAGHGVQMSRYNYLIPVDAELSNEKEVEYNCVRADRVLAEMESAGSKTNIVILDACRDNPFERSWRRGTEGSGLAFMDAPSGSLIAYSTAPGKTALDGRGKNSPYTSALLQHINTPNITVLQMFQKVRSTVINGSRNQQTPWESTSLKRDFFFNDQRGKEGKDHKEEGTNTSEKPNIKTNPADDKHIQTIKDLNKAIELDPNNAAAYNNRGYAYYNLKEYDKAIRDYDRAIELNPNDAESYKDRGRAYIGLDEQIRAIMDFDKALELNPNNVAAYNNRGAAYDNLKEYDKAIRDYDRAIELDPTNALIYHNRGLALISLNEYTKAILDFNRAIELNPNDAEYYSFRGMAYSENNEHIKAIKDLHKAIELNPNKTKYYGFRGIAYAMFNQHAKAIKDFSKAIELAPNFAVSYHQRGVSYANLKEYDKAISDFDRAIELGPNNAEYYRDRGNSYSRLGKKNEARLDLEKANSLEDGN